ncbi:hypothetical protein L1987_29424 [Smallanthus sonchifolius]|uniref:Uncharacterized protein n=1 Tax=Smallanthus sonchifolius TaxID=185202 RepID=A0ACB9I1S3_9ASTR|nr:hypothetical protein L1987_29424 [Smallanthus sonchifolius]
MMPVCGGHCVGVDISCGGDDAYGGAMVVDRRKTGYGKDLMGEDGGVLRTNKFKFKFRFKSFAAEEQHKVHNNNVDDHACMDDDKKLSSMFCKAGLLVRVPSRGLKKIGRAVSMRKHEGKEEELELCKKRIIMGKKCRPLNVSGALHYDKNGVLVPEDFIISPYNHSL